MATVQPITSRQSGELSRLLEERGVGREGYQFLVKNPDLVVALIRSENSATKTVLTSENWLDLLCEKERQAHFAFFHEEFDLAVFRQVLEKYGFGQFQKWQDLQLEPHFLPKKIFQLNSNFPGWKVKPKKWFWEKIVEGKLLHRDTEGKLVTISEVNLGGIVVLVDTRQKPKYKDGKQMWSKDQNLLGKILTDLRESGKIVKHGYGPQCSRLGVSAKEIDNFIIAEYAKVVGLEASRVRLERAIEGNVISQLYSEMSRKGDGQTNTSVWYDELFGDAEYRLNGGNSDIGGLANVNYDRVDDHWNDGSFRLLGVLGP